MTTEYDDEDLGGEVVRSFMLTRGRTRATVEELGIERLISVVEDDRLDRHRLGIEQRLICDLLSGGSLSIAEIAAHLSIPLRAAIVLVSEMVAAETLCTGVSINSPDYDLLLQIHSALQLL